MKRLFLAITCLLPAACATPYQPMASDGGYYQERLSENEYLVGFNGNGFTNYEKVAEFSLLRAAHIGEELGYTYFSLDGQADRSRSATYQTSSTSTTTGSAYMAAGSMQYSETTTTMPSSYTVHKPRVLLKVRYFDEKPEERLLDLRDVSDVIQEVSEKYEIQ